MNSGSKSSSGGPEEVKGAIMSIEASAPSNVIKLTPKEPQKMLDPETKLAKNLRITFYIAIAMKNDLAKLESILDNPKSYPYDLHWSIKNSMNVVMIAASEGSL